jgi:signal recognition particle subunit SRP54
MVLAELGSKLTGVLRKLQATTVVDEEILDSILKEICRALMEADVNVKLVGQLRNNVKASVNLEDASAGTNRQRLIRKAIIDELVKLCGADKTPFELKKGKPNVVMFVGLQGSGKTTTIAKYANYYARKGWKCAMVCADTFRAGAFDQLKQNATKLRIPFYGSYTEADPVRIAEEGVAQFREENYEIIIIDTSGRHKQEDSLFEEMEEIHSICQPDETIFVMDSTIGQAVFDQANAFRQAINIGSVIITKLDGHAKGGGALSAVAATDSPIVFIGTGEHFDDLEPFVPTGFVSRLLGMGDMAGLLNDMKDLGVMDKQPELVEKFSKGIFTLRDMYEQFQNVMKLGPLNKVMGMIPGIPDFLKNQQEQEGGNRLKRFMFMMDSMTDTELDGRVDLHKTPDRVLRISIGSGTHPNEVMMLLKCHKQFEGVVKKMGKTNLLKSDQQVNKQIARNPNQVMQQLSKAMDPRMLQQMGGAENMMKMMKQMNGMDPSQMGEMMQQMGGMGGGMPGMGGGGGGKRR